MTCGEGSLKEPMRKVMKSWEWDSTCESKSMITRLEYETFDLSLAPFSTCQKVIQLQHLKRSDSDCCPSTSPCFGRVKCFPKANNKQVLDICFLNPGLLKFLHIDNTTPCRPGLSHTNLLSSWGSPRDGSIHGGGAFHETNLMKLHVMKKHCYRNNGSWIMRWSHAEQFPSCTTSKHLHCQNLQCCHPLHLADLPAEPPFREIIVQAEHRSKAQSRVFF